MQELSDVQWAGLREFNKLVEAANYELADSFETGRMSDSKTAVFDMREAANALDLPDILASELRQMAQESWRGGPSAAATCTRGRARQSRLSERSSDSLVICARQPGAAYS